MQRSASFSQRGILIRGRILHTFPVQIIAYWTDYVDGLGKVFGLHWNE